MQIVIRRDCASFGQRGLKTCKSPKTKLCHVFKVKEAPHKRLQGAKSTVNKHLILGEALFLLGIRIASYIYIQNDNLSQN